MAVPPAEDETETRDLVPFMRRELRQVQVVEPSSGHNRAIEARDERVFESPLSVRETFKAAASALRVRMYHGATPASTPIEDFRTGTVHGRRAFLEGTPSAVRLLMGFPFLGQVLASWVVDVEVRVTQNDGRVLVGVQLRTSLPQFVGKRLARREFDGLLADLWRLQPIRSDPEVLHDPVVGPNQLTPAMFTGSLRDYSRCAALDELDALRSGDFPIGRYLWPTDSTSGGSVPLFLGAPRDARGLPSEHLMFRNVCVTAPVGSGKTYSIFRPWAIAAARAGFSTIVFDPKGDLAPAIREPVFAAGNRVVVLASSPEQPSVAWNFMDEVEIAPDGRLKSRRAVEAILSALLPKEDGSSEHNVFAHQVHRGWLSGFIQIAKYALGDAADASTLFAMARDIGQLTAMLDTIKQNWPEKVYSRLYYEVNDLYEKSEYGYAVQLRGIANALEPFTHEPLLSRTSARAGGRRFRVSDMDRRPTTLILACSLQDLEVGQRLGSIATALLLARIYERKPPAPGQTDTRIPMLLLLDETPLLNIDLAGFLAVSRGFKAGVVSCYQELDQIGDEAQRHKILANSNTVIALRGVSAGSRRALLERMAKATTLVPTRGTAVGEDARGQDIANAGRVEVSVLGEYEILALPGPQRVAVVHIQDGTVPRAKPFLVDLTQPGGV